MSVYLAQTGMANMFLTENPDISYFRTVYIRDASFTTRNVVVPFDKNNPLPGDTLISTIPRLSDYITGFTLKLSLPNLSISNVNAWSYPYTPSDGDFMYGFNSSDDQIFTIYLAPRKPSLDSSLWYKANNVSVNFLSSENKFNFQTNQTFSYVVFSNSDTARLFGFIYNQIQLFSGFVKINVKNTKSQVTLQECGWLKGSQLFAYSDDICYKFVNTVSLYIGKQLIQELTSDYIKFYEDVNTTCKNKPVLKLVNGDSNPIDYDRVYYFSIPFINVPLYALKRHDIHIVLKTNNLTNFNFVASMVLDLLFFDSNVNLPSSFYIPINQIQYFDNEQLHMRGPVKTIITNQPENFTLYFNGEKYCDFENTKFSTFENFKNVTTSNVVTFDGPINMSRIIDQKWKSTNVSVHVETINILAVENDMAGILFDYTEKSYKKQTSNALVQIPPSPSETLYLFDYIPNSASNVVAAYSMRRVNVLYTGPVIRVRDSVTLAEADFYTDGDQTYLVNSSNVSISDWSNNQLVVSIWYDQSGNDNIIYQGIGSPFIVKLNNKYVIYFQNPNQNFTNTIYWLTVNNTIPPFNQFTCILNPTIIGYNGSSAVFVSQRNTTSNYFSIRTDLSQQTSPSVNTSNVNSVINGTFTLGSWNTVTASNPNSYFNNIKFIADNGYLTARSSFTGYMFELCFFTGNSLTTSESNSYYSRRPF